MPPNSRAGHDEAIAFDDSSDRLIETTPYYDIEVSKDALFDGAFNVVSCVFPNWKHEDIEFVQCKDGITNQCNFFFK